MKTKAFSIAILLLVVLAFSGVASAATQQVLVSDAYDEEVLVSPAYDEEVLVSEAWNETIFNHYLVNGEYTVFHPAVYETVHHDAVYETVEVVDQEAYDEQVLVQEAYDEEVLVTPAYDEQVEADHNGYKLYGNGEYMKKSVVKYFAKYYQGQTMHGYLSVPVGNSAPCQSKDWKWVPVFETIHHEAVYETVHHEAVYETVHHPAVTHEEQVLVQEAYDEQVLVQDSYYEQVPYSGNGPYFGVFPDWNDIDAWADWIYSHEGSVGGWGSWIPYYELVFHPAVYETVHHDAVYETVHHPAVYKDVEVADPVVDEPVKEEAKTIPMEETGVPLLPLGIAALLVFLGLALVGFRRRDE